MAAAATSSSSCHHRLRLLEESLPGEEEEQQQEARDWAELPWDALLGVLHRLDHVDILMGAGQVCRPWRRAARDEPELWRRVDMRFHANLSPRVNLHGMARAAVRRSAGQCEAFWGEGAADDRVVTLLGDAAPSLKSLRLISCDRIVDSRLKFAITKFTLLEELELSLCLDAYPGTCQAIGDACPLLKRLRLSNTRFYKWYRHEIDQEATAIATMRGLRSLQLFANPLSDRGLVAILDGCPRLESLDIRHCFNVEMGDEAMRARCSRIKTLRLPDDSTRDYDLEFSFPDMDPGSPRGQYYCDWHELVYFSSW